VYVSKQNSMLMCTGVHMGF